MFSQHYKKRGKHGRMTKEARKVYIRMFKMTSQKVRKLAIAMNRLSVISPESCKRFEAILKTLTTNAPTA